MRAGKSRRANRARNEPKPCSQITCARNRTTLLERRHPLPLIAAPTGRVDEDDEMMMANRSNANSIAAEVRISPETRPLLDLRRRTMMSAAHHDPLIMPSCAAPDEAQNARENGREVTERTWHRTHVIPSRGGPATQRHSEGSGSDLRNLQSGGSSQMEIPREYARNDSRMLA
jgi:hypothetical protein